MAFQAEGFNGQPAQVECAKGMRKAGMQSPGVYQVGKAQLLDAPKPLKIRVLDQVEYQVVRNGNETINRVVEYFAFVDEGRQRKKAVLMCFYNLQKYENLTIFPDRT
jgi:hypothetical protein